MGYSISEKQYQRLEANAREGRSCHMNTGRGGCFTRATIRQTSESWPYRIEEGTSQIATITFCKRHSHEPGFEGRNFRVLATERF